MYQYKALIKSVYDGDGAFDAIIDLGFGIKMERKIRLAGVDTPELRGEQKEAGRVVRDFVRDLILNKEVTIHTHKDETGKYGRILADIKVSPISATSGTDLGAILVSKGYAKQYFGGRKEAWTEEDISRITSQ